MSRDRFSVGSREHALETGNYAQLAVNGLTPTSSPRPSDIKPNAQNVSHRPLKYLALHIEIILSYP
jgi:hypothetical protein